MTKTKALTKLMLVGTVFAVSIPVLPNDALAKDYLSGGSGGLTFPPGDVSEGAFNSRDKDRAQWYSNKGQNSVYKTYRNFIYFYSPVRPRDVNKGLADYSGTYENWLTRKSFDDSRWTTRHLLATTNKNNSKYNQNFKTRAIEPSSAAKSSDAGRYIPSKNVDKTGQFAGINGEWRNLGYGTDGASVGNPLFPEDYNIGGYDVMSYPYVVKPWNTTGWAKTFVPGSTYDSATATRNNERYNEKRRAIGLLRKQMPLMQKQSISWWADRLSLMSDPIMDSAQFRGAWTPPGSQNYVEWTLINQADQRNLMIEEMTVRRADNGAVVAKFNRTQAGVEKGIQSYYGDKKLYSGQAYNVEVKVKNLSSQATTLNPSEIEVGFKENYNANVNYPANFKGGANGNEFNKKVTGAKIAKNASRTFNLNNVVIPDRAENTTLRFSSMIGAGHRLADDNLDTTDDIGVLPIRVVGTPGDMKLSNTQLINEAGKAVANPIPGEKYKVRYSYKYTGSDIRTPVYSRKSDKDGNVWYEFVRYNYPKVSLSLDSKIERTLPGKVGNSLSGDILSETIRMSRTVRNGNEFVFTTSKYETYEVPHLKASGDFNIGSGYERYNSNAGNDAGGKEWKESYDYSVKDLQVVPRTERTPVDGQMNVAVSFTAVQTLPNTAKNAGFEQAVDMKVIVDGRPHYITEHLKNGENKNITFETTINGQIGKAIHAEVLVNDTAQAWETDLLSQANNTAKTAFVTGLVTSTSRYNNDLNSNTAGFITNAMLFPTDSQWETKTSNQWAQTYQVHSLTGEAVTYQTRSGATNKFFKYRNEPVTQKTVNQKESYEIEEVLFKSKYTKDNELGQDGWVDMKTAQDIPRIKAGYGYELKVTVKYDTDALTTQPGRTTIPKFSQRNSRTGNATLVRPYHTSPNIPNDVFVKTPDGKTLSVSGSRGTIPGLVPDASNGQDGRYTFTLKASNPFGVKEAGKIYVGEEVKDGEYGIEVWTPVINGIATKNMKMLSNGKTEYTPSQLADFQQLNFEVKGSATDDLVDTILQ